MVKNHNQTGKKFKTFKNAISGKNFLICLISRVFCLDFFKYLLARCVSLKSSLSKSIYKTSSLNMYIERRWFEDICAVFDGSSYSHGNFLIENGQDSHPPCILCCCCHVFKHIWDLEMASQASKGQFVVCTHFEYSLLYFEGQCVSPYRIYWK